MNGCLESLFEQGFYPKTGVHFWETLLKVLRQFRGGFIP